MRVTIKDISEMTGFSPATVSNALNNKRGVNRATAEKILAVAAANGYLAESKLQKIKFVLFKRDGVIVRDTAFFSAVMEGVEMESRAAGYEMTVCTLNRGASDYDTALFQLLGDSSCGLILLGTEMLEEDAKPFANALAPVVVLDNWFEETVFDAVLISNTDSAYAATRYLIRREHREIGYLAGSIRIKNFYYREMGFRRALKEAGLEMDPRFVFPLLPTVEGAYRDMLEALSHSPALPTAFFADNDIIALGAMRALRERGVRVPEDVSVVGFDDMPFSAASYPALTTVRVPKEEMGREAVRRLLEIARDESGVKTKTQVCSTFVERESVRKITR